MTVRHARRILSTMLAAWLALLVLPGVARAADKLTLSGGTPTVYVQSGAEGTVQVAVTNNSGAIIKGVTLTGSSTVDSVTYTDRDGKAYHPERFSRGDADGKNANNGMLVAASGATHETDQAGYRIAKGKTATFTIRLRTYEEEPGTYTEWVQFGDIEQHWVSEGGYSVLRLDTVETYSAQIPVKVVVYNPKNAALAFGTKDTEFSTDFTPPPATIDFGTINLANESALSSRTTYYVKNVSPTGNDEHGNSPNIQVDMGMDLGAYASPFGFGSDGIGGARWAPLEPATPNSYSYASGSLTFDGTYFIAGTYTANLVLSTTPHGVKVNGGKIQTSGRYVWPVKVTLTGTNPRLPARVSNLSALAGNGLVELSFGAKEGAYSYNVYRRDGKETQTNGDKLDWSKYEKIAEVTPNEDRAVLFVDGTVENGKTYSYTVICGQPYQGYAAKPVVATPKSTLTFKLLAPERIYANEEVGGVNLEWEMNELYGGDKNSGAEMVDHFNIYRNGVLVAQVDQSAVNDLVSYGWISDDGGETYHYGISGHEYGWSLFVETPQLYTDYVWNISAVSKSGVEGYLSEDALGQGVTDKPTIITHSARYDAEYETHYDEERDEIVIDASAMVLRLTVDQDGFVGIGEAQWWRTTSTKAPDTSKAPYASFNEDADGTDGTEFIDKNVAAGKTYTYTARVRDEKGDWSNYYTFTCKAQELDGVDDGYYGFAPANVTWKVIDGKKASMEFVVGETSTCTVYRNGTALKTYKNLGEYVTFTNDPGIDGTYTYRVDRKVAGITITGREYVFVRNTAPVDESAFGQVPGAPTLTARTSGSCVILSWQPSATGGEPEGFYIYRKDAGVLQQGGYTAISHHWNGDTTYHASWGNARYLKIQDADVHTFTDGASDRYLGDASLGILNGLSWRDESLPHEWYVTAYNARGESAPSNVIVYDSSSEDEYGNKCAPANEGVEGLPGKPTITKMWVEWEDSTSTNTTYWGSVSGHVHVAWKDTPGDLIDHWNVYTRGTCTRWSEPDRPDVLEYWRASADPTLTQGGEEFTRASVYAWRENPDENDIERTVTMSVEAENSVGAVSSDEMQVVVHSIPRFRALPDNGSALLEWTDLVCDTTTQVNAWQMWRRREHGTWQLVETLAAPLDYAATDKEGVSYYSWRDTGAENGWTYEYKVTAVCADCIDRTSVVREVTPDWAAVTEEPGVPQNLKATIVNGIVYLNWDHPTTGGAPQYYYPEIMNSDTEKSYVSWVRGTSTTTTWKPNKAGTYYLFVYSHSHVRGSDFPYTKSEWQIDHDGWLEWTIDDYLAHFPEMYPTMSNVVTLTITEDDLAAQDSIPEIDRSTKLTLTPGEGQITLNWNADPGAIRYEINRHNNNYPDMPDVTIAAVEGQKSYSFVDTSAQPGVRYRYQLSVTPPSGGGYYTDGYATALGKGKDTVVVEQVEELIAALPDPADVGEDNAAQVAEAAEVWDNLTDAQKKLVDPELAEKLADAAAKIEAMDVAEEYGELAAQVQAMIDALPAPENVTLADSTAIRGARTTLNNLLPKKARALVDTTRLAADEAALDELQKYAQYAEAAAAVQVLIDALPDADAVTLNDADAIELARAAYDGLTPEDAKKLVQIGRLTDAEAKLEQLRAQEQYGAEAAPVQKQVNALPEAGSVTLDDAAAIEAARAAYDKLSDGAKQLVDVARLEAAEEALAAAREAAAGSDLANATIDAIPDQIWFGGEVYPEVVVRMNGTALEEGADYELTYEGNAAAGTATVTATGIGGYQGAKQAKFKIIYPFTDVNAKTSHSDKILWLAGAGITRGWGDIPNAEFRPNANVKRGDMAAFLFRLAKLWGVLDASDDWQPSDETRATFVDVSEGTAHAQAIWWMGEMGISTGWALPEGGAEFRPNANVKRGDLAAFLGRLAEKAGVGQGIAGDPGAFVDVGDGTAHHEKIWWMAAAGISTGWPLSGGGAEFRPNAEVKRGDMAAFIQRLDALR